MAHIVFSARFYGDGDGRRAEVVTPVLTMTPLHGSSSIGDPVSIRVRASVSGADVERLTGGGWTDAVVSDAGHTVAGKVSQIEISDGAELENLITPGV